MVIGCAGIDFSDLVRSQPYFVGASTRIESVMLPKDQNVEHMLPSGEGGTGRNTGKVREMNDDSLSGLVLPAMLAMGSPAWAQSATPLLAMILD
jgi:hypothetical protein